MDYQQCLTEPRVAQLIAAPVELIAVTLFVLDNWPAKNNQLKPLVRLDEAIKRLVPFLSEIKGFGGLIKASFVIPLMFVFVGGVIQIAYKVAYFIVELVTAGVPFVQYVLLGAMTFASYAASVVAMALFLYLMMSLVLGRSPSSTQARIASAPASRS